VTKFIIELEPAAGDPRPPDVRLRRALKFLLRACGLRCTGMQKTGEAREARPPCDGHVTEASAVNKS